MRSRADNLHCRETSRAEDIAGPIIKSSVSGLVIYRHYHRSEPGKGELSHCMVDELRLTVLSTYLDM